MARERKVYPRDMVAHLWANASQDEARDPSGNMYFHGPALYSYGSHFVIGYRYGTADGGAFYIMNADTYSSTTSKMQYIARRALPGFRTAVSVAGLRSDTFNGQGWRGRLMREALAQAGREYESAANVSRVSAKRDAFIADAAERMRAADAIARAVLAAGKESRADDRKAARATLRTLESVPAWNESADNAGQKQAATDAAALLVRDEMRAKMETAASRAVNDYNTAKHYPHADNVRYRIQEARDSVTRANEARDIAKRYGFRVPKMPDAAALVRELEPAELAMIRAEIASDARAALESAESAYRTRRDQDAGAFNWRIEHAAGQLRDAERRARDVFPRVPALVPPAWIERADAIAARVERGENIRSAERTMTAAASEIASADSYAANNMARDALRTYRRAAASLDGLTLPASHPLAARLAGLAGERERIAAYIADAAAMMEREHAQRIAEWRDGGAALPYAMRDAGPLLRLRGDVIETSHGASVPASVAPRLLRLVAAARAGRDVSSARGLRVGHFTLENVRADGSLLIGCHDIAFNEVSRMADAMGLSLETAAA